MHTEPDRRQIAIAESYRQEPALVGRARTVT
jgi:hypothetical protein